MRVHYDYVCIFMNMNDCTYILFDYLLTHERSPTGRTAAMRPKIIINIVYTCMHDHAHVLCMHTHNDACTYIIHKYMHTHMHTYHHLNQGG